MKVKVLKQTRIYNEPARVGDVITIPDINHGLENAIFHQIVEVIEEPKLVQEKDIVDDSTVDTGPDEEDEIIDDTPAVKKTAKKK